MDKDKTRMYIRYKNTLTLRIKIHIYNTRVNITILLVKNRFLHSTTKYRGREKEKVRGKKETK